jgi:heme-degrading monooxygenase HmoA
MMRHVRVAVYQFTPGTTEEYVLKWTKEGSLAIYRQQPGFVAYEAIHAEGDTWISVTTWESREQADAGNERIGRWIRETPQMASLVRSRDHTWIGDLAFSTHEA